MKKFLLATVSSLALATAASAADAPAYPRKAPAAAAPWSWQGFYIGINGGAAWHRASFNAIDAILTTDSGTIDATGGTFGGHLGYNWQFGNLVLGVEGDVSWIGGSGTGTSTTFAQAWSTNLSSLATFRGRVGVTMSPTLLYVTGGVAWGRVSNGGIPGLFGGFPADEGTKTGWVVGAGIEHMLSFAPNWIVRGEVLYVDLGASSVQGLFGAGYTARFTNKATLARIGLSLKW